MHIPGQAVELGDDYRSAAVVIVFDLARSLERSLQLRPMREGVTFGTLDLDKAGEHFEASGCAKAADRFSLRLKPEPRAPLAFGAHTQVLDARLRLACVFRAGHHSLSPLRPNDLSDDRPCSCR